MVYAWRRLWSPEHGQRHVQIGHTDVCRLRLHGAENNAAGNADWRIAENRHDGGFKFKRGENTLLLKCLWRGPTAQYRVMFNKNGTMSEQIAVFGSRVEVE